jgi:hypothetical protein
MLETSKSIWLVLIMRSPGSREIVSFIEDWEKAVHPIEIEVVSGIAVLSARAWP